MKTVTSGNNHFISQRKIVECFNISKEEMLLLMKDCMYKNVKAPTDEEGDDGVKVQIKAFTVCYYSFIRI